MEQDEYAIKFEKDIGMMVQDICLLPLISAISAYLRLVGCIDSFSVTIWPAMLKGNH